MEPFIKVFFEVDKDRKRLITIRDLEAFVRRNDLEYSMVGRWRKLFDPENTGKISLEKFCDVLGLNREDVLRRESSFRGHPRSPKPIPRTPSPSISRSPTSPRSSMSPIIRPESPSRKQFSAPPPTSQLSDDVHVIAQSMAAERQVEISDEVRRLHAEHMETKEPGAEVDWTKVLQGLQQFVAQKYGGVWQTIVVHGSFWSNHWFTAEHSFIFHQLDRSFLVFRTS